MNIPIDATCEDCWFFRPDSGVEDAGPCYGLPPSVGTFTDVGDDPIVLNDRPACSLFQPRPQADEKPS